MAFQFQASRQSFELFGHFLNRREHYHGYCRYSHSASWEPAVNVFEDAGKFYICAELAGLEKDQVNVEVVEQEIRIHGERPVPIPCDQMSPECILRIEIDSGRFFRAIRLPEQADLNSTAARLDKGYLWITVAKTTAASPEGLSPER